jgi:hypothetical protein
MQHAFAVCDFTKRLPECEQKARAGYQHVSIQASHPVQTKYDEISNGLVL